MIIEPKDFIKKTTKVKIITEDELKIFITNLISVDFLNYIERFDLTPYLEYDRTTNFIKVVTVKDMSENNLITKKRYYSSLWTVIRYIAN